MKRGSSMLPFKSKYEFQFETPATRKESNQNSTDSGSSTFSRGIPASKLRKGYTLQRSALQKSCASSALSHGLLFTPHASTSLASGGSSSRTPMNLATPARLTSSTIVAVVEGRGLAKGEVGMAAIDLKGSELILHQFADGASYVKLLTKLIVMRPLEVLMPNTACENGKEATTFELIRQKFSAVNLVTVQRRYFNEAAGLQYVKDLCAVEYKTVEIAVKSKFYCLAATAALLKYIEFIQNIVYAPNSLKIVFKGSENATMIDSSVAKHLELVQNAKDPRSNHSLFGIMNHTKTAGGSRLLRANILQPPCDIDTINCRLDCIEELASKEDMFLNLQSVLSKFLDVEHLISLCIQISKKENLKTAETRITEIIYLKHTLELVKPLKEIIDCGENSLFVMYAKSLDDERFYLLLEIINSVINEDVTCQKGALNMRTQKIFLIKPDVNGLLDVVRRVYTECIDDINEMIKQLSDRFKMILKPAYSSSRGFFIQITGHLNMDALPDLFIKVVKSKQTINCTTEDLIKLNGRVTEALNEIYLLTNMVISELMITIREHVGCLHKLAEGVNVLDMIVSFAHSHTISNYVRPEFTDTLAIKDGRHPILEKILPLDTTVPNDAYASDASNFLVITGPNMSGKSTYLKQIALLQIMAQVGSFVPAKYASFRPCDQIFARIGTDDDIETNASTFTLEMKEMNYILQNTTEKSLVVIDELGRGTSVEEGVGLSYSLCEYLMLKKSFTFFATHFMDLSKLEEFYPYAENYHMQVQRNDNHLANMIFSHLLVKGKTDEANYGIHLAEMSSLPHSFTVDAWKISTIIGEREQNSNGLVAFGCQRKKAIFRLATRLLQVAQHSKLDQTALRVYLKGIKRQYEQENTTDEVGGK